MRSRLLIAVLALVALLSGCSPTQAAEAGAPGRAGVAEFAKVIAQPGVQIIDVRTPAEFADGHIAGAVNIPVQQPDFVTRIARLDPKATYAVYCRSGHRSKSAVAQMQASGIPHIYELESGTTGWTAEGHELVR